MVRVRVRVESQVELSRVDPQKTWVKSWVNLFLLQVKKIRFGLGIFWVGSENFDPFCHVYLHGNKLDN